MSLAEQIKHNLRYQHLWPEVEIVCVKSGDSFVEICKGSPPEKLRREDDPGQIEYVLPSRTEDKWSVQQWDGIFKAIKVIDSLREEPKRLLMAMVTDDSTIVYYVVHNGVVKPKKN